MNSYEKEAAVGGLVFLAVAGFVAGAIWLRGKTPGKDDIYVAYSDVATLKDASSVRISGAQVGRVDGISYVAPGKVIVGLKFDKHDHIQVTTGAKAVVTAVGVLGDYMIVFDPGTGAAVPRGDTIQGTMASGVMDKANALAEKAAETMSRIDAMLDTQVIADLRHTLRSADRMMTFLADTAHGPTSKLGPTLAGLQQATARFDTTLAGIDPRMLQSRLDSTMHSAGSAADRLAAMAARSDSLLARIQSGQGTMGKLISDTALYGDLRKTMQSMTDLLNDIRKNPGKVGVTVKIF
ncbi:MAG TPA: MlaD family protein [Gemmatimonadales bacterium]|jgi:phospholipid/cholesterol/gamma-HCH transport system substrate-binding protein